MCKQIWLQGPAEFTLAYFFTIVKSPSIHSESVTRGRSKPIAFSYVEKIMESKRKCDFNKGWKIERVKYLTADRGSLTFCE